MKLRIMLLGAAALIALAGCNMGQVSLQRDASGNVEGSLTLTEAEINTAVQEVLTNNPGLRLNNATADLQSGQIVVSGDYTKADGSTGQGNFTMTMVAQDGALLTQISNLNLEGWSAGDPAIQDINARMTANFQRRAARTPNLRVQSVTISDTEVVIQFEAQRGS